MNINMINYDEIKNKIVGIIANFLENKGVASGEEKRDTFIVNNGIEQESIEGEILSDSSDRLFETNV